MSPDMTRQCQIGQGSKYAVAKEAALQKEPKIPFQTVLMREVEKKHLEVNLLENLSCYLITWEARSEKRKATGHSFEPARKIPKELAFVDFSSDEESGLVDLREEADIHVVEAVNKYTSKDEKNKREQQFYRIPCRYYRYPLPHHVSSSKNPIKISKNHKNLNPIPQHLPSPPPPQLIIQNHLSPLSSTTITSLLLRNSIFALSAIVLFTVFASLILFSNSNPDNSVYKKGISNPIYATIENASLSSVLSNANHEVRVGFGLRVTVLLADIVAINEARKIVIVGVGGGAVVDWLLEMVAIGKDECGTQAEASTPATTLTISFSSASPHLAAVRRRSSLRSSTQRLFSFLASYRHTYGSNLFEYRTKNKESCISYIVYKRPTS
ncbi:hypothetical protein LWI28_016768 [Acer negundo]|uniref:Uncharacterized protein n=1 Tax=Acer negundo TaxID=4023 RepID=A0AAD5IFN0_ACENE|nr:hypothetical protein LWI28_016768 [Acer negundo]